MPQIPPSPGVNEIHLDELQALFDIYHPFVEPFVTFFFDEVLQPLASASHFTVASFKENGLVVISWLTGVAPLPTDVYFAYFPVSESFPHLGLTQLLNTWLPPRFWFLMRSCQRVSLARLATLRALSQPFAIFSTSFFKNVQKALKWLFFAGVRDQQLFPVLALEPSVVQDYIDAGDLVPRLGKHGRRQSAKEGVQLGIFASFNLSLFSYALVFVKPFPGQRHPTPFPPCHCDFSSGTDSIPATRPNGLLYGREYMPTIYGSR